MSATTIKLDGRILEEIARIKPPEQTLSTFVREAVERDVRQRKLREAAHQYQRFLCSDEAAREE